MNRSMHVKNKTSISMKKDYIAAYIMILPTIIGLLILNIIPFFQTIWMSFCKNSSFGKMQFSGFGNYIKMFQEADFWHATFSSIMFVIYTVPIGVGLALVLAVFLNSKIKGKAVFRAIYFLPMVVAPTAVAMVWKWILNSEYGILNETLSVIGITSHINWISNPKTALLSCAAVAVWSAVGYDAVLLLSGIQSVSKSYYEAAEIDGASSIQRFLYITVPMVSPTLFFVIIMRIMNSVKIFDIIYMMIDRYNPAANNVRTLMVYFYRECFEKNNRGYASAVVVWTFAIIMIITSLQFVGQKKWVNYDA